MSNKFAAPVNLDGNGITGLGGAFGPTNALSGEMGDARYLAPMLEATIKGRAVGAGTGTPDDLTAVQLSGIINRGREFFVVDYGASPSATPAANTAAVQAAVNACVAAGGGRITLPSALLTISHTTQIVFPKMPFDQQIKVQGPGGFFIPTPNTVASIYVGDPVVAAGGVSLTFEGVTFRGTSSTVGRAIRAENANGLTFKDCFFENLHFGIQSTNSFWVQMLNCWSLNVGYRVFSSDTMAHGFRSVGGAHYNAGIAASGSAFGFGGRTDNCVIRDGDFEFCRQVAVFEAGSSSLVVEGNYIEYMTVSALGFAGANTMVSICNNWLALAQGASSVGLDGTGIDSGEISRNWFFGDASNRNAIQGISPHVLFNDNLVSGSAVDLSLKQTDITSFSNGYSAGARTPGYRKQGNALYLTGSLTAGTNGAPAFTLPVGFRPRVSQQFCVIGATTVQTGLLFVDASNGNVVPNMSGGTTVGLDGVVLAL